MAACSLLLIAASKPADAAFPGENGRFLYCEESYRDNSCEMFSSNPDGSGRTQLTHLDMYGVAGARDPEASPDGKRIAFTRGAYTDPGWSTYDVGVYVMNADGTGLEEVAADPASDREPAWSPDGEEIAFVSDRDAPVDANHADSYDVYVANADGAGEARRITDRRGNESGLAWSPDSSKLLYVSAADTPNFPNPERDEEIHAMNPDGSGATRLTNNSAPDSAPDWAPDGNKIAFGSLRDGENAIYTMDPDGSEQAKISYELPCVDYPEYFDYCSGDGLPVWSPDGAKIAFVRFGSSEGLDYGSVYIVNPDGSGLSQSGVGFAFGYSLDWAPAVADSSGCTIRGTSGPDELVGTQGDDVVCGFRGRDTVRGLGGDDTLLGNVGVDVIYGGEGDDTLRGGNGADRIAGGGGHDLHDGGLHDDRLDARDGVGGNDILVGSKGEDTCLADAGDRIGRSCEE